MNAFVGAISILGGVILGVTILHWLAETVRRSAVDEERLRRLDEELALRTKQAEAMQKDVSNEDVARSLDDGQF